MEYVESYKELEVYKAARQLSKDIYLITKVFQERKCIHSQIKSEGRLVQSVLKLQRHGRKEDMKSIL